MRALNTIHYTINERAAAYGIANEIPMAFRAQEIRHKLSDEEVQDCPEGPCRAWLRVRQMGPSQLMKEPAAHEGLGLQHYVQVTSPVRRYGDLALHYQLKAQLRGEPLPFPADQDGWASRRYLALGIEGGKRARTLERNARAYWLKEFLRRCSGRPLQATVLGSSNERFHKLLLNDLGAIVDYQSSEKLELGSSIDITPNEEGEFV